MSESEVFGLSTNASSSYTLKAVSICANPFAPRFPYSLFIYEVSQVAGIITSLYEVRPEELLAVPTNTTWTAAK